MNTTTRDILDEVRIQHVPKQVFFGYPEDPETGELDDTEDCIACGERMPCLTLQLAEAAESLQDQLLSQYHRGVGVGLLLAKIKAKQALTKDERKNARTRLIMERIDTLIESLKERK